MLLFKPYHVPFIMEDRKTQTRRFWKTRRAVPGRVHQGRTELFGPPFAHLLIIAVWQEPLGLISNGDARKEGYKNADDYLTHLPDIIGRIPDYSALVWVVEFERLKEEVVHGQLNREPPTVGV